MEGQPRAPGVTAAVAARFPSMKSARVAIEALEHAGIDGDEIELLGRPADVARAPSDPRDPDRRMALPLVWRVALGAFAVRSPSSVSGSGRHWECS